MYTLVKESAPDGSRGRPRVLYTFDGLSMTGAEWAAYLHIATTAFYQRLALHQATPKDFPLTRVFAEHFEE